MKANVDSDQVGHVYIALNKRKEHGLSSWVLFLDLVKAFDKVPREPLWKVLAKMGVPLKVIRLLTVLHTNVKFTFTMQGTERVIDNTVGVKQGDILGPILFTFYIAACLITWRKSTVTKPCEFQTQYDFQIKAVNSAKNGENFSVRDSCFADDTGIIFVSRSDLEIGTNEIVSHFKRWGLEIHTGEIQSTASTPKKSKSEILFAPATAPSQNDSLPVVCAKIPKFQLSQSFPISVQPYQTS